MGHVTEAEIAACLVHNFRLAAQHCDDLAVLPARGPTYRKLRDELKLIEGCCRQLSAYREDTRWLPVGLMMAEAHRRAGSWLRDKSMPRTATTNAAHPLFTRLAENLRAGQKAAERLRDMATYRVGMILPDPLPGPHRETRPVQVMTPGGLIVPDNVRLH